MPRLLATIRVRAVLSDMPVSETVEALSSVWLAWCWWCCFLAFDRLSLLLLLLLLLTSAKPSLGATFSSSLCDSPSTFATVAFSAFSCTFADGEQNLLDVLVLLILPR